MVERMINTQKFWQLGYIGLEERWRKVLRFNMSRSVGLTSRVGTLTLGCELVLQMWYL